MSTRSQIAFAETESHARAIYCHHDGYPTWNGMILMEHFNTRDKARDLVTTDFPNRSLSGLDTDGSIDLFKGINVTGTNYHATETKNLMDVMVYDVPDLIEYIYLYTDKWMVASLYGEGIERFKSLDYVLNDA